MALSKDRVREYLAYYGANIDNWPEEIRVAAYKVRHQPAYVVLFEEEEAFERLLNSRNAVNADAYLAQRIITATLATNQQGKSHLWVYDLVTSIKPAAVAATLVLGFVIGFGALSPVMQEAREVSYSDDDGTVL